jgi:hypothetical protein
MLATGLIFTGATSALADEVPSQTEVATSEAVVPAAPEVVDILPATKPAEETVVPTGAEEETPAPVDVPSPWLPWPSLSSQLR